jgi:hypothetical protein
VKNGGYSIAVVLTWAFIVFADSQEIIYMNQYTGGEPNAGTTSKCIFTRERVGEKVYVSIRGKTGKYVAEFWHHDQHCRRALGTRNRVEAKRRALLIEADLQRGQYASPQAEVRVADAIQDYLQVKRGEGKAHKTLLKYEQWCSAFQQFLLIRPLFI